MRSHDFTHWEIEGRPRNYFSSNQRKGLSEN